MMMMMMMMMMGVSPPRFPKWGATTRRSVVRAGPPWSCGNRELDTPMIGRLGPDMRGATPPAFACRWGVLIFKFPSQDMHAASDTRVEYWLLHPRLGGNPLAQPRLGLKAPAPDCDQTRACKEH
eukprot:5452633-Karenia_brevis.AAC.1